MPENEPNSDLQGGGYIKKQMDIIYSYNICNICKDTLAIVVFARRPPVQNLEANKRHRVIITGLF